MPSREFTIGLLPLSKNVWQAATNGGMQRRRRIKKMWEEVVWGEVNRYPRMPRPVDSVRCDLVVSWNKRGPLPDDINLEMAFECIADGLVKAGIIVDDQHQFVRGTISIVRGRFGHTEVKLTW
jgi:hypothetical protein